MFLELEPRRYTQLEVDIARRLNEILCKLGWSKKMPWPDFVCFGVADDEGRKGAWIEEQEELDPDFVWLPSTDQIESMLKTAGFEPSWCGRNHRDDFHQTTFFNEQGREVVGRGSSLYEARLEAACKILEARLHEPYRDDPVRTAGTSAGSTGDQPSHS